MITLKDLVKRTYYGEVTVQRYIWCCDYLYFSKNKDLRRYIKTYRKIMI